MAPKYTFLSRDECPSAGCPGAEKRTIGAEKRTIGAEKRTIGAKWCGEEKKWCGEEKLYFEATVLQILFFPNGQGPYC